MKHTFILKLKSFRAILFLVFGFAILSLSGIIPGVQRVALADVPSTGYATALISNPSSNLTDFTVLVDLVNMPASWWSTVNTSDATKGRAAKDDGTELAADWIAFDSSAHTGYVRVKWSGTLVSSGSQTLRIYPPVAANNSYALTDTYGGYNAYASHWEAYFTLDEAVNNNADGYKDRTENARHGTGVSMAISAVTGKVGNAAKFDGTADYIKRDNLTVDFTQGTILTWSSTNASGVGTFAEVSPATGSNRVLFYYVGTSLDGFVGSANVASKASAISASTLASLGFTWNTTSQGYEIYVNGSAQNADLGVDQSLTTVSRNVTLGSYQLRGNYFLNGYQDDVQIHSVALSSAWIAEEYAQTNNNSNFWGTWSWDSGVATIPDAPTGVTAATSTSSQATISFTPGSNGGSAILYYLASSTPGNITGTSTGSPIVVTGLTNDTSYTFAVYAVNTIGTSSPSSASNAVTPTVSVSIPTLSIPTVATTTGTTTATLSSNITNTGGVNATARGFNYGTTTSYGSATSASGSFGTGSFTLTATGLNCSTTYHYQAYAVNSAGTGTSTPDQSFTTTPCLVSSPALQINYVSTDANGVKSYNVTSDYLGGVQHVLRILEPNNPSAGVAHNFLYVLPVSAEGVTTYGDGLDVLRGLDAQNQYNVTIVAPSFAIPPWYADSDSSNTYRYESFMTRELQPWVQENLDLSGNEQSWLLGFSKSGYGVLSLLFRNPNIFTLAAAWDFPGGMSSYNSYEGGATNYGTQTNFDNNYRFTNTYMDNHKGPFIEKNRVWIGAYSPPGFLASVQYFDALLATAGVSYTRAPDVSRTHEWASGWVPSALAGLYANSISLDATAPIISLVSSGTPAGTGTTITWTTDENASSEVDYGLTNSYGSSTSETDTSPRVASHSVALSGLEACVTYHYRVHSKDASASGAIGTDNTFTTSGCTGSAMINAQTASDITTASGGSLDLLTSGKGITLTVPVLFAGSDADFQIKQLDKTAVTGTASTPSGYSVIGSYMYDLKALSNVSTLISSFNNPLTVSIAYDSSDITGLDESSLKIYRYDGTSWNQLTGCIINTSTNTVACTTTNFSVFGLFGQPTVVVSTGGSVPPDFYQAPVAPQEGFRITVNNGATTVSNRNVTLGFNAGSDATFIAISTTGDFTDAAQVPYTQVKQFDLCSKYDGAIIESTCPNKSYTIYAKFFNHYGRATSPVQTTVILGNSNQNPSNFTHDLRLGSISLEVKALQQFLNQHGFILTDSGGGSPNHETAYFGRLTSNALIRFQQSNQTGNEQGVVGPITRNLLNSLTGNVVSDTSKTLTTSAVFETSMYQGVTSNDVRRLQTFFATKPVIYPEGLITGYFGNLTRKAVQNFQLNYNVVQSEQEQGFGVVGPATRAKILDIFGN